MPPVRISEPLRISILRWTKPMTVRATGSWRRFTPSGGQEEPLGRCGTSLRPGGQKPPRQLPGAASSAAISSTKNVPRKPLRNCSTSSARRKGQKRGLAYEIEKFGISRSENYDSQTRMRIEEEQ